MKVVILGYGAMLTQVIAGVKDAGCEIVGVLRHEKIKDNPIKRFLKDFIIPEADYNYIKSYNLYELKAKSANSEKFKKEILKLNADVIVVCSWGERLKKEILNLPKIACINVHPGLLPQYRGPNPCLEAIRHLETKSGVTIHLMEEKFDTGSILAQKFVDIEDYETSKELRKKIEVKAREAIGEVLIALKDDYIIPLKQDENKANYYPKIKLEEVMLDFTKSAKEISAHIRAFYPWYLCFYEYKNQFFIPNPYKLRIDNCKTEQEILPAGSVIYKNHKTCEIGVLTGDKQVLYMQKVKLYGKLEKHLTSFYIKHFVDIV